MSDESSESADTLGPGPVRELIQKLRSEWAVWQWGLLGAALLVPWLFIAITGQVWEDFLITYRHSQNLIDGEGMLFNPGEKIHGFTSVINTLLPAFFGWITGADDYVVPLWMYRTVSWVALSSVILLAAGLIREGVETHWQKGLLIVLPVLLVLEIKVTAFAMNGQEAGFMLLFLVPMLVLAYRGWPKRGVLLGGVCLAGLMYTRPDGFVYGTAAFVGGWLFCAGSRKQFFRYFVWSGGISLLIYLPWAVIASSYYGTFVPHTVLAKQGTESYVNLSFQFLGPLAAMLQILPERMVGTLAAIYDFQNGGDGAWPGWLHDLAFVLMAGAVLYWIVPVKDRLGRMTSLIAMLILAYLSYASLIAYSTPWYYPPLAFLSLFTLLRMVVVLPRLLLARGAATLSVLGIAVLLGFVGYIFTHSLRGLKLKQEVIDDGVKRELGLWLNENVGPEEIIYLEPLGYIGYYSDRRVHDWPGLVSPEVVAVRKEIGKIPGYPWGDYTWGLAAERYLPEWLVARPVDQPIIESSEVLRTRYAMKKIFNVAERIYQEGEFPGAAINYNDSVFIVYRRIDNPSEY